ncbi:DUF4124 domain-containing protein [Geothrix sp. 21YS21S-4]|uniref:DUF4124 domain-containing protein n=1 Tax=Geothrix sp. 21YS21S-4 TaxID=3068889 RepID=UPI0027B892FD|nr:DUF4124 domain-containing protein [Geothrix sp. 21YS21S-4]
MTLGAALLLLALAGPSPRTYYWRDPAGQVHITNTPPPADAEILQGAPSLAMESRKAGAAETPALRKPGADLLPSPELSPAQAETWAALDAHLARARAEGNRRALEAAADSLIDDSLWGGGLWMRPALPLLSVALLGLMGWWLALGAQPSVRLPLLGGFLLAGLALGHLLLTLFLYHPQAVRLRRNLELLERHMGAGRPPSPERRALLQRGYGAVDRAGEPTEVPWRFPQEVAVLRDTVKQVMVEP